MHEGRRMTPSHASRGDVRYRYYNSVDEGEGPHPRPIRIAARDIGKAVIESFERLIADRAGLTMLYPQHDSGGYETADIMRSAGLLHRSIPTMAQSDQRALLLELIPIAGKIGELADCGPNIRQGSFHCVGVGSLNVSGRMFSGTRAD